MNVNRYSMKSLKGILRPILFIDINTHSVRKWKNFVKFI